MKRLRRVIFLGRKPYSAKALEYLVAKNIEVTLCIAPRTGTAPSLLEKTARRLEIPVLVDDNKLYKLITRQDKKIQDIDLVISYLYPKRILQPLLSRPKRGCINFHPAPLPDYKSRAGYNTAILDQRKDFGVSVHFIDSEKFDAGPIIRVLRFPIDVKKETAYSLEKKSQEKLFTLFIKTIDMFLKKDRVPTHPNKGGLYLTSQQLEHMKEVSKSQNVEMVHRMCRAFFFPPYTGAHVTIGGEKFTLINQDILDLIAKLIADKKS